VTEPTETIELRPDPEKGTLWPDAIGCGGGMMGLYVSDRVKESLDRGGIRYGKAFPAVVSRPYPKKLKSQSPPKYFYVTGELGAKIDFEASGFKIKFVCPRCGHIRIDPASKPVRDVIKPESWNGSDIFYTDLSKTAHFCSERLLALARESRWTNFRFVPLEEAHNYAYPGLDYLR
jgi:hypothetical protein